jgi:hypothetical protein
MTNPLVPPAKKDRLPWSSHTDAPFGVYTDSQGRKNLFICRQNPADPTFIVKLELPCKAPAGFAATSLFKIVEGVAQSQNALNIVIDLTSSESFDEWQILGGENLTFVQFQETGAEIINSFRCGSPQSRGQPLAVSSIAAATFPAAAA